MFEYEPDTDRPRSFRPDLHAQIKAWLDVVPEDVLRHVVAFRVGPKGTFVVKFMVAPTGATDPGHLRLITYELGAFGARLWTDTHTWRPDPNPGLFHESWLVTAADTQ